MGGGSHVVHVLYVRVRVRVGRIESSLLISSIVPSHRVIWRFRDYDIDAWAVNHAFYLRHTLGTRNQMVCIGIGIRYNGITRIQQKRVVTMNVYARLEGWATKRSDYVVDKAVVAKR
jgi:hypothetical protein